MRPTVVCWGCGRERPHHGRNRCRACYEYWRKHGTDLRNLERATRILDLLKRRGTAEAVRAEAYALYKTWELRCCTPAEFREWYVSAMAYAATHAAYRRGTATGFDTFCQDCVLADRQQMAAQGKCVRADLEKDEVA